MTDRFVSTARVMADFLGLPDYPFVTIAHPISNNTDEELNAKAEEALVQSILVLQSTLRLQSTGIDK